MDYTAYYYVVLMQVYLLLSCVCPPVSHKPVLHQTTGKIVLFFGMEASFQLSYTVL